MLATDLNYDRIVDDSYKSTVLGHRCARFLDPNYVVPRDEILEIIAEASISTSSAVDSQPWHFLIIDTDEAKQKLDDIMHPIDKDRVKQCSFALIPMADRQWPEYYDDITGHNKKEAPGQWDENFCSALLPVIPMWYEMLLQDGGRPLDKSIDYQAGQISQSFQFACRAHGLDTGVMDAWAPDPDLNEAFGVDLERYIPEVVICVGKNVGAVHNNYRREPEDMVTFF